MLRRAFVLLCATVALAGCGGGGGQSGRYAGDHQPESLAPAPVAPQPAAPAIGQRVAILLPLSGPRADLGAAMLKAAQIALPAGEPVPLDAFDTAGTPEGAAAAAQAAIGQGAGIILGPLTSAETAAVAPIARDANVAVLAFTNDPGQAQPGVWTLGITPGQQVRRLVAASLAQDKNQFGALLPDSDFGRVMADALTRSTVGAGLPPPVIQFHTTGMPAITAAAKSLSDYGNRRGPIDAQIRQARALGTADGRRHAQELAKQPIPPPPFNALLLADTGDELAEVAAMLPYYDVDKSHVQIIGPALWALPASGSSAVNGAWYAAPDPAARANLEQSYAAQYGDPPPPLADLAYDAASIARVAAAQGGFSVGALTQPAGYAGMDGWLALLPDGQVRRGLAVFRIEPGGPQMVEPAPQSGEVPGT